MASGKLPEQIIGNYTLLDELGKGAFAHVYLAQNNQSGKYVAIKLLDERHLQSPAEKDLRREGEILEYLLQFHCPYILSFIEQAECSGRPYIVIQHLRKGTLRAQLKGNTLESGQAVTIITQIGEAISTIHQHHIVHCDITPENILFNENDQAILTDFGIAIRLPPNMNSVQVSPAKGTPLYMAPEQFEGIITKQGDQYSLGCIAYELFTGTHPVESITSPNINNMDIMKAQHSNKRPEDPRRLNLHLEDYIGEATLKAIAKVPEERHEDVNTFVKALHQPRTSPATTGSYAKQIQIKGPAEVSNDLHLPENHFRDFLSLLKWVGYQADPAEAKRSLRNRRRYTRVWEEAGSERALIYIPEEILDKPSQTNRDSIGHICSAFKEDSILIIVSKLPGYPDGEISRIVNEDWPARVKKGIILPWRYIKDLIDYKEEMRSKDREQEEKENIKNEIKRLLEMP